MLCFPNGQALAMTLSRLAAPMNIILLRGRLVPSFSESMNRMVSDAPFVDYETTPFREYANDTKSRPRNEWYTACQPLDNSWTRLRMDGLQNRVGR